MKYCKIIFYGGAQVLNHYIWWGTSFKSLYLVGHKF